MCAIAWRDRLRVFLLGQARINVQPWRPSIEMVVIDGSDEPSGLQVVIQSIEALDNSRDIKVLRSILRDAVRQLGMSEVALLEEFLADRTGFGPRTISTMVKEARNYVSDFGYLHTVDDVVKAYADWLRREYGTVVSCGSGLHVYESSSGSFEFTGLGELEVHILDTFGNLPLFQRGSNVQLVIKRLRLAFSDEEFFADARPGVNLRDGFLSIDTDGVAVLLPHSPGHKARMQVDVAYDADASFEWLDAALRVTLPLQQLRDALQEIAGAILFNITPLKDGVRRMFILHGARSSGKSTLINMLEGLLPSSAVSSVPPEHWNNPNFLTALENVLLNSLTELGSHVRINGEYFKKIVSGERIMVRQMRRDPVGIVPRAWHLCAANELPRIIDKTDAFERRILVVTFPHSLTEGQVDGNFNDRLRADPNAVLAWAIEGAARLVRNGKFTLPAGHQLAAAEMQFGDDWPMVFAHTQAQRAPGNRVTTDQLRIALGAFARSRNVEPPINLDQTIRKVVGVWQTRLGAVRRKSNGAPFYEGVLLVSPQEPVASDPAEVDLDDL